MLLVAKTFNETLTSSILTGAKQRCKRMGTNTHYRPLILVRNQVHPILFFIHNLRSFQSPPDPLFSTTVLTFIKKKRDDTNLKVCTPRYIHTLYHLPNPLMIAI